MKGERRPSALMGVGARTSYVAGQRGGRLPATKAERSSTSQGKGGAKVSAELLLPEEDIPRGRGAQVSQKIITPVSYLGLPR